MKKGAFFRDFSVSFVIFNIKVKGLKDKRIRPISNLFYKTRVIFVNKYYMSSEINLMRMEADISAIHAMLQEVKEQTIGKVYNTKELSEYLKVGKAVIDKLRQDGELEFSKLGRTIVYTQRDIEKLLEKNHFSFVA